jgi:hypothetical protein
VIGSSRLAATEKTARLGQDPELVRFELTAALASAEVLPVLGVEVAAVLGERRLTFGTRRGRGGA